MTGELIDVDPINRRGLLRPGGDVAPDRYNRFLGQPFALLPYGMVYYHGAPAELKDIPLGTVLHGVFYLPPEGDDSVPRPKPKDNVEKQRAAYFVEHTHALLLGGRRQLLPAPRPGVENRGDRNERTGRPPVPGRHFRRQASPRRASAASRSSASTRARAFGRGRNSPALSDIQPGQTVQVNLTWDPELGLWQVSRLGSVARSEIPRRGGRGPAADPPSLPALSLAAGLGRQGHLRSRSSRTGREPSTVTLFGGTGPVAV